MKHVRTANAPGFAALFTPKLVTVLREGYGLAKLRADLIAGLTVAVVALPLSMAIAMASGASPAQGLYTSIIGGFLVSLLGGSRFQIGGPAGAFIVLVAATVQAHGMSGLLLATLLSGVMLTLIGWLRLGSLIRLIPYPVTVGFTAGIALIIFASQLKPLLGLTFAGQEPGPLLEKLPAIWQALPTASPVTMALALATIATIVLVKRLRPRWPGMLVAIAVTAGATALLDLPVATIGSAFGGIPETLPMPSLPALSWNKVIEVLPSAVAFTLLGAIESLLSAVVADGMSGRRHRANCELVAQGVANVASALFGGICVTGTIARTATNVRAGAVSPIAGMLHALLLLLFILLAAPLLDYIPLASLAGVLAVVAWNMIEKHAFVSLLRASRGDAAVLLITLLLTVFRDLTEGILAGTLLGALLFIQRMSRTVGAAQMPWVPEDVADTSFDYHDTGLSPADPELVVYRLSGAWFFGAATSIESILARVSDRHRGLILDFTEVPFIDVSAARALEGMLSASRRAGIRMALTGTHSDMRRMLFANGVRPPLVSYERSIEAAVNKLRRASAET
ncbi:STAS domain-containing protein [Salinicola endophyticus]|uniref:STAS domain-containing protein n=1 Tax=Salinicola endophyticus TaxID=1949083 RepID=A0ABY8FIE0_9GAMM|nr:SulP family inorganic anion transporter [Salinicola endophyticus]WFF42583.1 STAS domain-containing protein [Salinicola endophyticus]